MEIPITLKGKDEASGPINAGFDNIKNKGEDTSKKTKERFKEMSVDIARNFSGGAGQIVGHLSKMPSALGIVAAAAIGAGAALFNMVTDYAKANKSTSADSNKFLASLDRISKSASSLANTVSEFLIPVFNSFLDLIGQAPTNLELLNAATLRSVDLMKKQSEFVDKSRQALTEYLELTDNKSLIDLQRQYFELVGKGRLEEARLIANTINQLNLEKAAREQTMKAAREQKVEADKMPKAIAPTIGVLEEEIKKQIEFRKWILESKNASMELHNEFMKIRGEVQEVNVQTKLEFSEKEKFLALIIEENDARNAALDLARTGYEITKSAVSDVSQALAENIVLGKDLNESFHRIGQTIRTQVIKAIIEAYIKSILLKTILNLIPGLKSAFPSGENGIVAAQDGVLKLQAGSVVRRPTFALIGENGPEAVVPLSQQKSRQRETIVGAAGLNTSNNISININNVRSLDEMAIRNVLIPRLNRMVNRGDKLLSTKSLR